MSDKIQVDERSVSTQTAHISGRLEKLYINTTGQYVWKGKIITEIYSQELVTEQEELFEAKKMKAMQPQLFTASKERLKNWKLSDSQIENILLAGMPQERFPIRRFY